jgi:hypothetical protein
MAEDAENAADLAGVRCDGQPSVVVRAEDGVQNLLAAGVLRIVRLRRDAVPELIVLGEAGFEIPGWEEVVDVRLCAAMVTSSSMSAFGLMNCMLDVPSMNGDALSQQLLDRRQERIVLRQAQTIECQISSPQAACEWRNIVRLRVRNLLHSNLMLPEVVRNKRLIDTVGRQVGVVPLCCGVAVDLGPVTVPARCAVICLRRVVVAFAVPSCKQDLVHCIQRCVGVEPVHLSLELLPLCQVGGETVRGRVVAVDQAEVGGGLDMFG